MNQPLIDTAPDFDQPIAVLKHCHGRIRKQLATLEKLLAHLPGTAPTNRRARPRPPCCKYFDKAAHLHHDDEEQDLIPMLRAVARGEDAATLQALAPVILQDHKDMDAMWQDLHEQLSAIADGSASYLSAPTVQRFVQRYQDHMEREESTMAPMALRLFARSRWRSWARPCSAGAASTRMRPPRPPANRPAPPSASAWPTCARITARPAWTKATWPTTRSQQFTRWFEEALKAEVNEPNAMGVSTVGERRPAELAHRAGQAVRRTRLHLVHQLRQPERKAACQQSFCGSAILLE
jgi:pyridoxamine 5'-phosphate oxidase